MIKGNLTTLVHWLKQMLNEIPAVKAVIYGDAVRLITYSRSNTKFSYPVVHIGRPVAVPMDNEFDRVTTEFFIEITCMAKIHNTGVASFEEDESIEAETMAMDILLELDRKLRAAARVDEIDYYTKDSMIEPTLPGYIDKATGYKLSCKIVAGANKDVNVI